MDLTKRLLPFGLLAASAALFSRAGFGPLADLQHRGQTCTLTRCPHNAAVLAALGIGLVARRRRSATEEGG